MYDENDWIGEYNRRAAERTVFDYLGNDMVFAGIEFNCIELGLARTRRMPDDTKVEGVFDVLLYKDTAAAAAIIEIEHQQVGQKALKRLIDVQLPRFRTVAPKYKDARIYLGLCGTSFEKGIAEEARSLGIATLTLSGDAVEIDDEGVKAW